MNSIVFYILNDLLDESAVMKKTGSIIDKIWIKVF